MLSVAICDDEHLITGQIEEIINKICRRENILAEIDVFFSGELLEQEIGRGKRYDLLYLDIQMENGDGIQTAKNIRRVDENVIIVFVSGYDRYMMELFRLDVFAFVRKPIEAEAFSRIFLEANQKIGRRNFYFSFHYKNEEFKIPCRNILYFESRGRQIKIHSRDGKTEVFNGKLADVERRLAEGKVPFLRIHQSFLVNYHMIKVRNKKEITLITGEKLPISEDRQKQFCHTYGSLLGGEIDV